VRALAAFVLAFCLLAAETPAELFDRAVRAINAGDYLSAETALTAVLAASPSHVGALQNLGLVYVRTGRIDQAIATYRRALEFNPKHRGTLTNLGIALVQRRSYADAVPIFRTLFELYPDAPAAREPGLLVQLVAAAPDSSADLLRAAPAPVAAFVRCSVDADAERFDTAIAECRAALSVRGARRELGRALVGKHDPAAISELAAAVRDDPSDAQAHYYLGVALLQADRPADAAQSLERARQLDSTFWGTWFYLGKTRLKQTDTAGAIPLLERAAELNPKAATVFYELGLALKTAGRTDEARRAMDHVRELRAQELRADQEALHRPQGREE